MHNVLPNCVCDGHHAHIVPSRVGAQWATLARLSPLCTAHVDDDTKDRFDMLQDALVRIGQRERGPFFSGLPSRWFRGLVLRFRCVNGHVHSSANVGLVVGGECPVCVDPVALTFPEDESGRLGCADGVDGYFAMR